MISATFSLPPASPADSLPEDGGDRQSTPPTSSADVAPVEPTTTLTQLIQADRPFRRDRETLKVILVGSRNTITQTIRQLHKLGFAEAGAWSPLLPTANQGQFISLLNRYWLKQD